jgi:hypothetical protein
MAVNGRPTKYTKELADKICELISTSNKGLRSVCKEVGVSTITVLSWLNDENKKDFLIQYARAKEEQADFLAEEILEIADDAKRDTITVEKGGKLVEVENTEWVNRSKLRVDARKWIAAKLKPKKYGDKIQQELSGSIEVKPITGMEVK